MKERYPDSPPMGLFTLSKYGVPVALSGMCYVLIASPFLLPGGTARGKKEGGGDGGGGGDKAMIEDSLAVGRA